MDNTTSCRFVITRRGVLVYDAREEVACSEKSLLLDSELIGQDRVDERRRRDSSSSDTRLDFKRIHYDDELFVLISWTQTPINYRWLPDVQRLPCRRPSPRVPPALHHGAAAFVRGPSIADHASKSVLGADASSTLELR